MQLNKYRNKYNQIWLNVASSTYVIEDFVNLDNHLFLHFKTILPLLRKIAPSKYHSLLNAYIEALSKAKLIKHDCRKKLKFPDNSTDHIICSHFLEHVFPEDGEKILRNFYDVLKPGGTVHMIVPDINKLVNEYLASKQKGNPDAADVLVKESLLSKTNKGSFSYRLMEFHGGFGLQHRWMYDYESLKDKLEKLGFKILQENATPSSFYRKDDGSVHIVAIK